MRWVSTTSTRECGGDKIAKFADKMLDASELRRCFATTDPLVADRSEAHARGLPGRRQALLLNRSLLVRLLLPLVSCLFVTAVCRGQQRSAELSFAKTEFDESRAGHLTLEWNRLAGAARYRVTDAAGATMYVGVHERAFVSGLPDGEYQFQVAALDQEDRPLAVSSIPATVVVRHWPLSYAVGLFACGLVVVCAVLAVIVRGALSTSNSPNGLDARPAVASHRSAGSGSDV